MACSSPEWVEELVTSVLVGREWQDVSVVHGIIFWVSNDVDLEESVLASVNETIFVDIHDLEHRWQVLVAGF